MKVSWNFGWHEIPWNYVKFSIKTGPWWFLISSDFPGYPVNLTNKFQWNLKRNRYIFIQENAFDYVVCQNDGYFVQGGCVKIYVSLQVTNRNWLNEVLVTMHPPSTEIMYWAHLPCYKCHHDVPCNGCGTTPVHEGMIIFFCLWPLLGRCFDTIWMQEYSEVHTFVMEIMRRLHGGSYQWGFY